MLGRAQKSRIASGSRASVQVGTRVEAPYGLELENCSAVASAHAGEQR